MRLPNINMNATEFKLILNFKLHFETNAWNGPNLYILRFTEIAYRITYSSSRSLNACHQNNNVDLHIIFDLVFKLVLI